jgi:DNA-binding NarL/FixJ family response regulator
MINLIVADDHVVLRQALCELLTHRGNYNIVAQASNGEQLLALLSTHKPDLVIMDVAMPRLDGIAALSQIYQGTTPPPVLVLSADEGEGNVRAALKAGAKGFLPKHAALDELEFAISAIVDGKTYLSPSITDSLVQDNGDIKNPHMDPLSVLTKREVEIMRYLADGMPNREIGKLLHISTRTVDTHRSNILKKLNVRTNAELVKLAIQCKLITV